MGNFGPRNMETTMMKPSARKERHVDKLINLPMELSNKCKERLLNHFGTQNRNLGHSIATWDTELQAEEGVESQETGKN